MNEVVVSLKGGLGNQMFQYAAARALALRRGASLALDCAWFSEMRDVAGVTSRAYALEPFGPDARVCVVGLPVAQSGSLTRRILRRLRVKLPIRHAGARIFTENAFSFDPQVLCLQPPVWLDGYWQSHKYFADCADTIRSEFGTPRQLSPGSSTLLAQINASEAVCIHVRRGDYVTNPDASAVHGLCGLDYYEKGLESLQEKMSVLRCFVFSDDPAWVRENMKLAAPITVVDVNGPDAAHEDLWLMAACRHFVIANSSLSWWAAWLGAREGKKVVAPARWFKESGADTSDLIPAEWIRI